MADPKPQYVANLIVQEIRNFEFQDLRIIAHDVIASHNLIHSDESIWDYVEQYVEDISNVLFEKESYARENALARSFDIDQDGEKYYVKRIHVPFSSVYEALCQISPKQFEHFCTDVIKRMGGNSIVNGGSTDDGVDFIGEDIMLGNEKLKTYLPNNIYLIGQAKHYCDGHEVTLKEGREFIGAAMKFRDKMIRSSKKQFQPFIFAFWTTSDFHKELKDLFQSMGVWTLNGEQLSSFAYDLGFTKEVIESYPCL